MAMIEEQKGHTVAVPDLLYSYNLWCIIMLCAANCAS